MVIIYNFSPVVITKCYIVYAFNANNKNYVVHSVVYVLNIIV